MGKGLDQPDSCAGLLPAAALLIFSSCTWDDGLLQPSLSHVAGSAAAGFSWMVLLLLLLVLSCMIKMPVGVPVGFAELLLLLTSNDNRRFSSGSKAETRPCISSGTTVDADVLAKPMALNVTCL